MVYSNLWRRKHMIDNLHMFSQGVGYSVNMANIANGLHFVAINNSDCPIYMYGILLLSNSLGNERLSKYEIERLWNDYRIYEMRNQISHFRNRISSYNSISSQMGVRIHPEGWLEIADNLFYPGVTELVIRGDGISITGIEVDVEGKGIEITDVFEVVLSERDVLIVAIYVNELVGNGLIRIHNSSDDAIIFRSLEILYQGNRNIP